MQYINSTKEKCIPLPMTWLVIPYTANMKAMSTGKKDLADCIPSIFHICEKA